MNFSVFLLVYAFSVIRPPHTSPHPTQPSHVRLLNTNIGRTDMKRSDRKLKHGSCEWKAGRREWATQKRKLMSSTSASSTRSRRSKRFVFRQDSASILQSLDMISLQLFFMFAFRRHSEFMSPFPMKYLWAAASSCLSIIFLSISELPRRTAHLQAPHRVVQSINPETHCRLPDWRHDAHQTHDGDR